MPSSVVLYGSLSDAEFEIVGLSDGADLGDGGWTLVSALALQDSVLSFAIANNHLGGELISVVVDGVVVS